MSYSGIGGQAVMEGVMMKNGSRYAVAVRKPDGDIVMEAEEYQGILAGKKIGTLPFIRGVINFIDSLILGMKTLNYSASFYEEDETDDSGSKNRRKEKENDQKGRDQKKESAMTGITMVISMAAAIVIFMLIPYFISSLFAEVIVSRILLSLLEGGIRLAVFLGYILLISRLKEIQRVFMYHGAEHKCINCIEQGLELNVENVRKSSRLHKRCGTSFLFLVMFISIIFFLFIHTDSGVMRIMARLIMVPVIAGCAYEFIRLAGRSESALVHLLSMPGMALQRMTTKEPDDSMIEVGIASVEAVFDWKEFLKKESVPRPGAEKL